MYLIIAMHKVAKNPSGVYQHMHKQMLCWYYDTIWSLAEHENYTKKSSNKSPHNPGCPSCRITDGWPLGWPSATLDLNPGAHSENPRCNISSRYIYIYLIICIKKPSKKNILFFGRYIKYINHQTQKCEPRSGNAQIPFQLEPWSIRVNKVTFTLNMKWDYMLTTDLRGKHLYTTLL